MIDPIWTQVHTAYDPYIAIEKYMMIDGNVQGLHIVYQDDRIPDCVFLIHHAHILIEIDCYNFTSIDQARDALIVWMFDMEKTFKCSTVTDCIDFTRKYEQNAITGVNSTMRLDKDKD